jgi:hypothetical protein
MKSIMITYPNFRALPKGVKQMLLVSESFFFDQTPAVSTRPKEITQPKPAVNLHDERSSMGSTPHASWIN